MTDAIKINNLSKRYSGSDEYALRELNLSVSRGEVYGFLGPNGSGKSTTIRLLLNFIMPSDGGAQILGKDIVDDSLEIKKSVGYLSGDVALYKKMTGLQFLRYMSDLQPLKRQEFLAELVGRFQADINVPLRSLSKGNRQKIGIIQAFMHEPDVLILDEPTGGLDPLMQEEFFKLIAETKARGACVFFSSHNLAEVQKVCDRVGFIRQGRLVSEQTISSLSETTKKIEVTFSKNLTSQAFDKLSSWKVEKLSERSIVASIKGDLSPFLAEISKYKIIALSQREANLEEEFMHFYSGDSK